MKKVLIVEDELVTAYMLRYNLDPLEYTIVDTVSNGREAIEAVRKYNPDIILMDINIREEMDGIETMEYIRQISPAPVIYITGSADNHVQARTIHTSYSCLKIKPLTKEDLKKSIDQMLTIP